MESQSSSGYLRASESSDQPALRIIAHCHTAAWGIVDLRRSLARAVPSDPGLADGIEALLKILATIELEATHAYSHAAWGACPGYTIGGTEPITPGIHAERSTDGTLFRMVRDGAALPTEPSLSTNPRHDADYLA